MLFNSYEFIFGLLPLTWLVYALMLRSGRREAATLGLLLASLVFYGWWNPVYVALLLASIGFNYMIGLVERARRRHPAAKGALLAFGVTGQPRAPRLLQIRGFFVSKLNAPRRRLPLPQVVLPLGISFFTFTRSLSRRRYQGKAVGARFTHYALFVTYLSAPDRRPDRLLTGR